MTIVCCQYSEGHCLKRLRLHLQLPVPKRVCCNTTERSATLRIGNASLDIYPSCDTEQMKKLVELLRLC